MTLGCPPTTNTISLETGPLIASCAAVVGPKEAEGPLGRYFDSAASDNLVGESSWEKAERAMLLSSTAHCLEKAGVEPDRLEALLAGDLLNQIVSSGYAARDFNAPFLGLYGACSTFAEALILGAALVDGGYRDPVLCATSSHHYSAERQFRVPTEFAAQRPPQSQWTVTGAGSCLLTASVPEKGRRHVVITGGTVGRVVDYEVTDPYDMGSAMAPAAVDTLLTHFRDTGRRPSDYDLILTGDLGRHGRRLALDMLIERRVGMDEDRFLDAGIMIYDESQRVDSGGSGCACSAAVFCGYVWRHLNQGDLEKVLLIATGALHSPIICKQGESIPALAHAVSIQAHEP